MIELLNVYGVLSVKVKRIEWSEESKANEEIRYNHVIGKTPLGNFEITWKGWKASPSYTVEHTAFGYMADHYSLDDAKEDSQKRYQSTVLACLDI